MLTAAAMLTLPKVMLVELMRWGSADLPDSPCFTPFGSEANSISGSTQITMYCSSHFSLTLSPEPFFFE